jgi:hypothetical protein
LDRFAYIPNYKDIPCKDTPASYGLLKYVGTRSQKTQSKHKIHNDTLGLENFFLTLNSKIETELKPELPRSCCYEF